MGLLPLKHKGSQIVAFEAALRQLKASALTRGGLSRRLQLGKPGLSRQAGGAT